MTIQQDNSKFFNKSGEPLSREQFYNLYASEIAKSDVKWLIICFCISAVANVLLYAFYRPQVSVWALGDALISLLQALILIKCKHWALPLVFTVYGFFCMSTTGTGGIITLASIYALVKLKAFNREYREFKGWIVSLESPTYGSTFLHKKLKITIGNPEEITISTCQQNIEYINIPVTIVNTGRKVFDLEKLDYEVFAPDGSKAERPKISDPNFNLPATDIYFAGLIDGDDSTCGTLYIPYKGDGEYLIKFGGIFVTIPITNPNLNTEATLITKPDLNTEQDFAQKTEVKGNRRDLPIEEQCTDKELKSISNKESTMKKSHVILLCLIIAAATVAITLTIVFVAYRPAEPETEEELTYGSTFTYKDLEITIGNAEDVAYSVADYPFPDDVDPSSIVTKEGQSIDPLYLSGYKGYDIFKLPITVKNKSEKAYELEDLKYTFYGPDDLEILRESLHTPGIYDEIRGAGTVRKGGAVSGLLNIRYIGDGDYYVEFGDNLVRIPITKPVN